MSTNFAFQVLSEDSASGARCGRLTTSHGTFDTPAFMPVGTQGTVKGLLPEQLAAVGTQIVLANTYHLALRPGAEVIAALGGLHRFMGWSGPILTDSGGFQIYSLADLRHVSDEGVEFRSHIDGSTLRLTPEQAIAIQESLGADIIMCLDECLPHGADPARLAEAVRRTVQWARRCQTALQRDDQALFAIVQGGTDLELRRQCTEELVALDFPGYALGGLSVGELPQAMHETVTASAPWLPKDRPRYLMGVGRPEDVIRAIGCGIDMFDCVLPTRNGRNGVAFTSDALIRIRNQRYREDSQPLDPSCPCPACRQFSRAYLRHLFQADEMLGPILLSLHNVAYYQRLVRDARQAIQEGRWSQWSTPEWKAISALGRP